MTISHSHLQGSGGGTADTERTLRGRYLNWAGDMVGLQDWEPPANLPGHTGPRVRLARPGAGHVLPPLSASGCGDSCDSHTSTSLGRNKLQARSSETPSALITAQQ